jgi:hypothetical protein
VLALTVAPARADDFWGYWGDGKAELDGYALTQPRYGALRDGTAVLIFVTEDFSDSARVKADPGKHPKSDVYPVMKLNFVRDFQTGIYDYNVLTSTFARTEAAGWPVVKVSFSSQEWCGHVYQQWLARGDKLDGVSHSYFDGEADAQPTLPLPPGGVLEEQVPILVRGLRGDWVKPGESRTVPFLPSLLRARLEHKPSAWGEAKVSRGSDGYTVAERGGPTTIWRIEAAAPHKILAWKSSTGEEGKLLGSARLPYWELHDNGNESYLKALGLPVPARKTDK